MRRRLPGGPLLAAFASIALSTPALAQEPPPEVRAAVDAVVAFLADEDRATLDAFAESRLDGGYRADFANEEVLLRHLSALRDATAGRTGELSVEATADGLVLIFEGDTRIALVLVPGTGRISRLELLADDLVEPGFQGTVSGHFRAIEDLATGGAAARERLVSEHLSPALISRLGPAALDSILRIVRRAAASASAVTGDATPRGFLLSFRAGAALDVLFDVSEEAPYPIVDLQVETPRTADLPATSPPVTWATLGARLSELEDRGFAGTVLALRASDTLLHRSYGEADREAGRPNRPGTVYGIGSIPIDFTRTAVYLLVQEGALALDETLPAVFPDVPADKRGVTIRQLMDGSSGLPNFHHTASDADPDLTWIDRLEAERRILAQELLFEPGTSTAPSHSAFGLLAAAVERRSGMSYGAFLRSRVFDVAGMTRTGFYGEDGGLPADAFATGYGAEHVGDRNIPPQWGATSWLVMGSGGMWSTAEDMALYFETLRSGGILQGDALAGYLNRGPALGASDRGFLFVHAWAGGDESIYLAANAGGGSPEMGELIRGLLALVGARPIG